ncbi:hypothetical protein ACQYRI_10110 [Salmonella enterica]
MSRCLKLTMSGLHTAQDGILAGGNARVTLYRDGIVILREEFSGKVSGEYTRLYQIADNGTPVKIESASDCPSFNVVAEFVNPFSEIKL